MLEMGPCSIPSDQQQRRAALDTAQSVIVEAPAGSGKTDLLTRRYLSLIPKVEDPAQIVAITFTRPAAAEMRHRILSELEKASIADPATSEDSDPSSMSMLARAAWLHAQRLEWRLGDLPGRLRIQTIDAFCRDIAVQQPLLSGLGSALDIHENSRDLYRKAARRTLENIQSGNAQLRNAIETLLLWRDNNWAEMEDLLVSMLATRDRWMHNVVMQREHGDDALREQMEQPFLRAIRARILELQALLSQAAGAREELLALARFAILQSGNSQQSALMEDACLQSSPHFDRASIEKALEEWKTIVPLLLRQDGNFRKSFDKRIGFPATALDEKQRISALVDRLRGVTGFEGALASVATLPPVQYEGQDWVIVRACFTLLSHAAAELRVVFAEEGATDFTEVAQIAQAVLRDEDGHPSDAAIAIADGIRHILVDEFQDTSRRQHHLLASLIAAWNETDNRSLFVVGDPKQSIYFFRDADAELFPRVTRLGLELSGDAAHPLRPISLTDNFRTAPELIDSLNQMFSQVFAEPDGSGVSFTNAAAARGRTAPGGAALQLHLEFAVRSTSRPETQDKAPRLRADGPSKAEEAQQIQPRQIAALIQQYGPSIESARASGKKFRIAVLGRTHSILERVAGVLRQQGIPFYAVELEKLKVQPEILDALALGRALLNPYDRVAWLSVLRAPWCGLGLDDLLAVAGVDGPNRVLPDISPLLRERIHSLSPTGQVAASRVLHLLDSLPQLRSQLPNATLGTWLKRAWLLIEGHRCVESSAWANLELLWQSLDRVPRGTQGFLGGELDPVIDSLTALPDPESNPECGVQLMTIHRAKGLEFEVVIVPDLQAGTNRRRHALLSWLERGLVERDPTDAISELCVAPIQTRGSESGQAKQWVDREIQIREDQEMRRILYVAATRARDTLHLFARPAITERDGELRLVTPSRSLLLTAWPGLRQEVEQQFAAWKAAVPPLAQFQMDDVVVALAASESESANTALRTESPAVLRRLPLSDPSMPLRPVSLFSVASMTETGAANSFARPTGGWHARALGNAVHELLSILAQRAGTASLDLALPQLSLSKPAIVSKLRASGADPSQADGIAEEAMKITLAAAKDDECKWILSPHPLGQDEASWTGMIRGQLRNVRVDRLFLAGDSPLSTGESTLWIIDYKTTDHASALADGSSSLLRASYAPQLELYAGILRHAFPDSAIHAGLYYPIIGSFDWWKVH